MRTHPGLSKRPMKNVFQVERTMSARRYSEQEVRKILELATRDRSVSAPASSASSASGLTLNEIQSIGAEVGIESGVVARAAAELDEHPDIQTRAVLGVPFATGMTVALPRALTEEEWDQLVAELRSTFGARGSVRSEGSYKEWRNGNLHAVVERAPAGYRLRIATRKGNAAAVAGVGAMGIVAAAVTWATNFTFIDGSTFLPPLLFGGGGLTVLAANAARLPRWAKRRQQQMQQVASVIRQILARDTTRDAR